MDKPQHFVEDGVIAAVRTSGGGDCTMLTQSGPTLESKKPRKRTNVELSTLPPKRLQRQIQDLQNEYPDHELVQDVGSGLNFRRKGLQTLLERVIKGLVSEIVVTYTDRLCRYGLELQEFLFEKFGTKLVVHGQTESVSEARELADDLLSHHHGLCGSPQRTGVPSQPKKTEADRGPGRFVCLIKLHFFFFFLW